MEHDRGQYAAAAAAPGIVAPAASTNAPDPDARGTTTGGRGPAAAHAAPTAYEGGAAPQTSVDKHGAGAGAAVGTGLRHPTAASKPAWGREHLPGPAPNTAGPHRSDILNKLDPRVDSNMSNPRTIHAYAVANPGTMPGPAPNTAGPHRSDLLNKLDPRVDSDLSSLGGNPPIPRYLADDAGGPHQQALGAGGVAQEPAAAIYRHQQHHSSAGPQAQAAPPAPPMYAQATPETAGLHSTTVPGKFGTHADAPPTQGSSSEPVYPAATASSGLGTTQPSYSDHQGGQDLSTNYAYDRPDVAYGSAHHPRSANPPQSLDAARFGDSDRPTAARYYQTEAMSGGAGPPNNNVNAVEGSGGGRFQCTTKSPRPRASVPPPQRAEPGLLALTEGGKGPSPPPEICFW